jgi:hypothetical protein
MKPIESNKNPFYCVLSIIEACRERGAFQEEEMPLINDVKSAMQLFALMLESEVDACSDDCDCDKHLESCDMSCEETPSNVVQLELPLNV